MQQTMQPKSKGNWDLTPWLDNFDRALSAASMRALFWAQKSPYKYDHTLRLLWAFFAYHIPAVGDLVWSAQIETLNLYLCRPSKKRNTQNPSHHTTSINHLSHQPWPNYTKNRWPPSTKWTLQNCTPCPHSAALRWAWNDNKLSSLCSYKLHNIVAKRQPHHDQTRPENQWSKRCDLQKLSWLLSPKQTHCQQKTSNRKQLTPEPQKPHPKRWTAKSIQSHGTSNGKGRFGVRLYRQVRRRFNPNKTW